jgi:hypothetical protein
VDVGFTYDYPTDTVVISSSNGTVNNTASSGITPGIALLDSHANADIRSELELNCHFDFHQNFTINFILFLFTALYI